MKHPLIIAGTVTAMLAAAATGAGAQAAPSTAAALPMSSPMAQGTMPDYSLLSDPYLDYTDLKTAKAKGLGDRDIATCAKISWETKQPFRDVVDATLRGETFAHMAARYGLSIANVTNVADEQAKINDYMAAYETTGAMSVKDSSMSGGAMSPMPSSNMAAMPSAPVISNGPMMASKDIVDTAMSDKRFSTLVSLLKRANLVDTLKGPGPFTVFAPTNDAFKKLPKNTVKNLTDDQLASILKYHVLPAKVDAATAMAMTSPTSPPTVEGGTLQVTTQSGSVMVNDAKVTQADIMASNGIIHVIDTVLMPSDMSMGTTGAPMAPAPTSSTMPMTPETPATPRVATPGQ